MSNKTAYAKHGDVDPRLCQAIIGGIKEMIPRLAYIPTPLIMGYIATESSFRQKAVSSAGASGLMQLKPSTFTWIKGINKDVDFQGDDVFNIVDNITAGMLFIHWINQTAADYNFFARIQMYNTGVTGYIRKGYRANDYGIKVLSNSFVYIV